jgi:hypothetical protein
MNIEQQRNTSSAADGMEAQPVVLDLVPASMVAAMERAAVDNQVATAKAYPRSLSKFRQIATQMVSLDPDTAESCIYVRPVGKKLVNGKWEQEFAEGPSIRAAEIVAASYTNLRCKVVVIEQTERYVRVEAQAWDMENNVAASIQRVETTVKKDGNPYSESQRNLVALAAMAKAWRDAIFKVVPRALFKPVMDTAKSVANGNVKTIAERRTRASAWVSTLKIDVVRVFAALGVKGWDDTTEENLQTLTGLKTSIKEGDVTIDEAFPPIASAPPAVPHKAEGTTTPPASQKPAEKAPEPPAPPVAAKQEEKKPETKAAEPDPTPPPAEAPPAEEKPARKPKKEAEDPDKPAPTNAVQLLEAIYGLAQRDGVKIPQVVAFMKENKIMRKEQTGLGDLATAKLMDLYKGWSKALPGIQKQTAV